MAWSDALRRVRGVIAALFAVVTLTLNVPAASPASAAELDIIAVAPTGDSHAIQHLVIEKSLALPPGGTLLFYDALNQSEIVKISIPDKPSFNRVDRKAGVIAPSIARLNEWLAQMRAPTPGDPNFIHASPLLDTLAPVIAEYGGPARVMLVGGPWFSAPGVYSAKTYVGAFASDGLLLGSRSESPFGTEGRQDLHNVTVDYCVMGGVGVFSSPLQFEHFHRAWSLLAQRRGARLATFSTDMASCLNGFLRTTAAEGQHFAFDEADARVKRMERVEEATPHLGTWQPTPPSPHASLPAARWAPPAPAPVQRTTFDLPARTTPPVNLRGPAWIGIKWAEGIDLDLYARCSPNAPFLFYGNQLTVEGRHDFDFRGGTGQDFEVVELGLCPDISRAEMWVNFFEGSVGSPIKATAAIKFEGGLYKTEFTMPALTGNGGHDFAPNAAKSGPNWVRIDVRSLLHLPAHTASTAN